MATQAKSKREGRKTATVTDGTSCAAPSPDGTLKCVLPEDHAGACGDQGSHWSRKEWHADQTVHAFVDGANAKVVLDGTPKQMRLIAADAKEILRRLRKKHALLLLQKNELELRKEAFSEQEKLVEATQAQHDAIVSELLDATGAAPAQDASAPVYDASPPVVDEPIDFSSEEGRLAREMMSAAGELDEEDEPNFNDDDEDDAPFEPAVGVRSRAAFGEGPED